jgi:hypothetical protein
VGDESGVVAGGYWPSEYELWRDALMIAATSALAWPDETSLRTLAMETRSLLREGTAGRVGFDVQYRELHVEWRSLLDQVTAALAIHHPCHTAETEPWVCGRHSDPEHDGYYRLPAVCVECVDGDENPVPYPCPTAQALGVTR